IVDRPRQFVLFYSSSDSYKIKLILVWNEKLGFFYSHNIVSHRDYTKSSNILHDERGCLMLFKGYDVLCISETSILKLTFRYMSVAFSVLYVANIGHHLN